MQREKAARTGGNVLVSRQGREDCTQCTTLPLNFSVAYKLFISNHLSLRHFIGIDFA